MNRFVGIVLLLFVAFIGKATDVVDGPQRDVIDHFATVAAGQLRELIARNAENDRLGRSAQNQYVFNFDKAVHPPAGDNSYVKDVPSNIQLRLRRMSNGWEAFLNQKLQTLNAKLLAQSKPPIYVGFDEYMGRIITTTTLGAVTNPEGILKEGAIAKLVVQKQLWDEVRQNYSTLVSRTVNKLNPTFNLGTSENGHPAYAQGIEVVIAGAFDSFVLRDEPGKGPQVHDQFLYTDTFKYLGNPADTVKYDSNIRKAFQRNAASAKGLFDYFGSDPDSYDPTKNDGKIDATYHSTVITERLGDLAENITNLLLLSQCGVASEQTLGLYLDLKKANKFSDEKICQTLQLAEQIKDELKYYTQVCTDLDEDTDYYYGVRLDCKQPSEWIVADLDEFITQLQERIARRTSLKQKIAAQNATADDIARALLTAPRGTLAELTSFERSYCLHKLVPASMPKPWYGDLLEVGKSAVPLVGAKYAYDAESEKLRREGLVLALIETTPANQVEDILTTLKAPISNGSTPKSMIKVIMDETTDRLQLIPNFTQFVKLINQLIKRSPEFDARYNRVLKEPDGKFKNLLWTYRNSWFNIPVMNCAGQEVGTQEVSNVTQNADGTVSFTVKRIIKKEESQTCIATGPGVELCSPSCSPTYEATPYQSFDPFELIHFTNLTNIGRDGNDPYTDEQTTLRGQDLAVPALFLEYVSQKQLNDNLLTTVAITVDIATIATGPGAFVKAANWVRKSVVVFELANASGNLTLNLLRQELHGTQFEQIVDLSNVLMLGVGVAEGINGLANLKPINLPPLAPFRSTVTAAQVKLFAQLNAALQRSAQVSAQVKLFYQKLLRIYENTNFRSVILAVRAETGVSKSTIAAYYGLNASSELVDKLSKQAHFLTYFPSNQAPARFLQEIKSLDQTVSLPGGKTSTLKEHLLGLLAADKSGALHQKLNGIAGKLDEYLAKQTLNSDDYADILKLSEELKIGFSQSFSEEAVELFWISLSKRLFFAGNVSRVTKAITKARLSEEFIEALKSFGKSEDEILSDFTEYNNSRARLNYFNYIGQYLIKFNQYNLTQSEVFALHGYTTNFFYKILNIWLRNEDFPSKTNQIRTLINNALSKLPKYSEDFVYRGIEIREAELNSFLNTYNSGDIKIWNDFTSCGGSIRASFAERPSVNVVFLIKHSTGKDISDLADGIIFAPRPLPRPEILIKSGSSFKVLENPVFDKSINKWLISVEQVN